MEATPAWRPLGELIVERGLISQEVLEDALLEQRITHKRLGSILVDKGIVTAQQLTDSLVDQIGVEELLDEIDPSENGHGERDTADSASGRSDSTRRRFRPRLHIDLPASTRLAKPFSRISPKRSPLGHRRMDGPVAPFAPALPEPDEPEESFEDAGVELAEYDRAPEPELEVAPEPESEPEVEPEAEAEATSEPEPAAGPHAWLDAARHALDEAEVDVRRLDNFGIARTVELEEARAQLAEQRAATASAAEARSKAEEEVSRLHALIDERDAGLTAMEGTIEELRQVVAVMEADLHEARGQVERATAELEAAKSESERKDSRIAELEAQAADLAENLSATDETLGIEMHAREQAQREAKRLHDELDDRDARVAKLAGQVEALEAELEVVVAEREQSQRKLRSRERRMSKLESTLSELETASAPHATEPVEAVEPEAAEPEPQATELPAAVEPRADKKPKVANAAPAAEAKPATGFLYFVPREGDGYELVEQPGSAPEVGETIELDGKAFQVTRHSRSPMPFDRRTCVYLRFS